MTVYKIFLREGGQIKNLFRGNEINGKRTRTIKPDIWIEADKKLSVDGSGQDEYLTGIHCLPDRAAAEEYLNGFRTEKDRVVIECEARGLRRKKTNPSVILADELMVPATNIKGVI